MRIVVALGGNALQRRGEPMTVASERANVGVACRALARIAEGNDLVVTHGNGPQVGLLAEQTSGPGEYPFDVLGAATEGMIGYLIEQELGNLVPEERHVVTPLTQVEVDAHDPAFAHPTKFVGPVYGADEAAALASARGWTVRPDGAHWRRVVPSPRPVRVFETDAIAALLGLGIIVVCAGGGGIPTAFDPADPRHLVGVEAVIDKDRATAVLAADLRADLLVIATDTPAVMLGWGSDAARPIRAAHPDALAGLEFPAGSMGPKVESAVAFARTGGTAVIGALADIEDMVAGRAGTRVALDIAGIDAG